MKISAEVREFARLNPSPLQAEAHSSVRPELVEGLPSLASGSKDRASTGSARTEEEEAEEGMKEMSDLYRAGGNELYIGAGGREHD
jgi:phosphomethylpyrimidine synthase